MRRIAVFLLVLAAGCGGGGKSDIEKLSKSKDSWSASLDLVSHALKTNDVSPRYAKQIADAAEEELTTKLEKSKGIPVALASETRDVIASAKKLREQCERP